jgi:cytochrome oxidase assembly protein ShyY1
VTAGPGAGSGRAGPARTTRSALALLREPFWARAALVVVGLSVAFVLLGRWQLHRHEGKVARNRVIDLNYAAPPVALDAVLSGPDAPLPADRQWRPVRVTGHYEPEHEVLIRNRPLGEDYGYEVVVPLRLDSGAAFLVDRGWLPPGEKFVRPDVVPAPPAGRVTVVARVRPGEPPLDRTPPPGQELRIDLNRIAGVAGGPVYRGGYGVLASESPAPAAAPAPLLRPDEDLGPHLAYAFQWWLGAIAAYVLLGRYAVQEVRRRQTVGTAARPAPPDTPAASAPTASAPTAGEPTAPPVPGAQDPVRVGEPAGVGHRRRPWSRRDRGPSDEEWEDAATG